MMYLMFVIVPPPLPDKLESVPSTPVPPQLPPPLPPPLPVVLPKEPGKYYGWTKTSGSSSFPLAQSLAQLQLQQLIHCAVDNSTTEFGI